MIETPSRAGPASARNAGARRAESEILVFVDADVIVHPDAFTRIRAAFSGDRELVAVFGSYDDRPEAPGVVSQFRNLLHHHVHQQGAGPASTFWAGLGAIRRGAFVEIGGFDEARFPRPSIEDVELGMRLAARGARIRLDPDLRGTHLKRWTLAEMLRTDVVRRGIPWVELLLRSRSGSRALNVGWRHRLGALASLALAAGVLGRRPRTSIAALSALLGLNAGFYALLARRRGCVEAVAGVPLHAVHYLAAVISVPLALGRLLFSGLRGRAQA